LWTGTVGGVVSGLFAIPLHLRDIIPFTICQGESKCHEGQGLLNPPSLAWWAFVFVASSSGREPGMDGAAILAA
jgi:hypothetical protein